MKCKHCGEKFLLPIDTRPGLFFAAAVSFAVVGIVLWLIDVKIWSYVLFGLAGFVGLQGELNRSDLNIDSAECPSRTKCPKCKQPALVKPWSF